MSKPRILLISSQHLFGESMEAILRTETNVELVGSWNLNDPQISDQIQETQPSVVIIADETLHSETAAKLTQSILEQYPDLSVVRTGLNEKVFRIFSTHTLPARGADLLETIRSCITRLDEIKPSKPSPDPA